MRRQRVNLDTIASGTMNPSNDLPPPLPEPLQSHAVGPELNHFEMETMHATPILHSKPALSVNNNNATTRTFEPDNDDCAQPQQRPRLDDGARDSSTIFSQRTGTDDTLDTADRTIQIGSRSKKPSPDDQPTAQPAQVSHLPGSTIPGDIKPSIPSSLSFPSPPSVDDEEIRTKKNSSFAARDAPGTINSSTSTNELNQRAHAHMKVSSASSRKKRLCIILVALVVLVVVIVMSLKMTDGKGNGKGNEYDKDKDKDIVPQSGNESPNAGQGMASSAPTLDPNTGLNAKEPTSAPSATSAESEGDIALLSSDVSVVNQTEWDGAAMREDGDETAPTVNSESLPSQPPAQSPSLRRGTP